MIVDDARARRAVPRLKAAGGTLDSFAPNALALYNAWLRFGVIEGDTVMLANIGAENIDGADGQTYRGRQHMRAGRSDLALTEFKLALQGVGRKLAAYMRRGKKEQDRARKQAYIEKYIPHVGIALQDILGLSEDQEDKVVSTLTDTLRRSRKM